MPIDTVSTDKAPRAIGPYSQATIHNGLIYTAGQIPLDPASGEIVAGGVAEQTEQVFANLRAVLAAAGSDLSKVLKTTVFLADMGEFGAMNEVYARAFGDHRPARSTVQAAALPRAVRVEIDLIATR
ncbi:MAG TPA: RidA family protein [Gemmatimonadales bacterium]|nr:RidA family protein [Gemmatimonadales bacterium]